MLTAQQFPTPTSTFGSGGAHQAQCTFLFLIHPPPHSFSRHATLRWQRSRVSSVGGKFLFLRHIENKLRTAHSHRSQPPPGPAPHGKRCVCHIWTYHPPRSHLSVFRRDLSARWPELSMSAGAHGGRGPGLASIRTRPAPICATSRRSRFIEENNGRGSWPRSQPPPPSLSLSSRALCVCLPPGQSSGAPDHSSRPCVTAWSGLASGGWTHPRSRGRCESLRGLRWLAMFSRSLPAGPLAPMLARVTPVEYKVLFFLS